MVTAGIREGRRGGNEPPAFWDGHAISAPPVLN